MLCGWSKPRSVEDGVISILGQGEASDQSFVSCDADIKDLEDFASYRQLFDETAHRWKDHVPITKRSDKAIGGFNTSAHDVEWWSNYAALKKVWGDTATVKHADWLRANSFNDSKRDFESHGRQGYKQWSCTYEQAPDASVDDLGPLSTESHVKRPSTKSSGFWSRFVGARDRKEDPAKVLVQSYMRELARGLDNEGRGGSSFVNQRGTADESLSISDPPTSIGEEASRSRTAGVFGLTTGRRRTSTGHTKRRRAKNEKGGSITSSKWHETNEDDWDNKGDWDEVSERSFI